MREEKKRLDLLLAEDKAEMNEASHAAALKDLRRVAEEYFELAGDCVLTTRKTGRRTEAVFVFPFARVKNFTPLK